MTGVQTCALPILFDLRYNLTSIRDYVEEHDIDTVIVLYSFANFTTDDKLFLLGR